MCQQEQSTGASTGGLHVQCSSLVVSHRNIVHMHASSCISTVLFTRFSTTGDKDCLVNLAI